MTHLPNSEEPGRRRPSWYAGSPGDSRPQDEASAYRQPPSAAEAGGYGIPQSGYAPAGYGYAQHPGRYPSHHPGVDYRGYSPTPGTDELNRVHSMESAQAQSAATAALVLAIVGLFTAPFIMGPLAIWQASRARRLGHDAGAGWVLGWICTLWGLAVIALPFLFFLLALFAVAA